MALTVIDHQVSAYFQRILSTPPGDEVLNIFRKLHSSPFPQHKVINIYFYKLKSQHFDTL